MSRKDYNRVAQYLAALENRYEAVNMAIMLGEMFEKDNARFDRDRFNIASGVV